MAKLAVTLHELKVKQAEAESVSFSQVLRDGLKNLDTMELRCFNHVMEKLSGGRQRMSRPFSKTSYLAPRRLNLSPRL